MNALWAVDAATGAERLLADPAELIVDDSASLPPAELARRERTREAAGGITSFAIDREATIASFAVAGRLFVCDVESGVTRELTVGGPVFDPRPDPLGQRIAYVSGGTLRVAELDGSWRILAGGDDEPETVSWASADFIAAEEMRRQRGYWWNPDGSMVAATPRRHGFGHHGVDRRSGAAVDGPPGNALPIRRDRQRGRVAAPRRPCRGGRRRRLGPRRVPVPRRGPLVGHWSRHLDPVAFATGTGDSRRGRRLRARPRVRFADSDDQWVELVSGTPRLWTAGELVTCADRDGARRLIVDGETVTPTDLQVRSVVAADRGGIVFIANPIDDATVSHVWRYDEEGLAALTDEPGVHTAAAAGGTVVIRTATLDEPLASWVTLDGIALESVAATPNLALNASIHFLGTRRLATTVVLPNDHDGSPLPVLLDPYGGPHALRSLRSHVPHLVSQWFADHGFAVVVVDGRGTPGRGIGVGAGRSRRPRHGRLGGPDRRPRAGRRRTRLPRPRPCRDSRMELRWIPRGAGGVACARTASTPPLPVRR